MEKALEQLFTDDLLEKAMSMYKLTIGQSKKLGDFENYVFEVYKQDKPFILRLTHSSHRLEDDVLAELNWIRFLHTEGVMIPGCLPSVNGRLVEVIQVKDSFFYACLFEKASGEAVRPEHFCVDLYEEWGKVIGKMHQATTRYTIEKGDPKRPEWYEEELLIDIDKYIPKKDSYIVRRTEQIFKELKQLPQDKNNYGLIHSDIHSGNFFYDGNNISVFDFDDCTYHWFISDIAIPLYYATWWKLPEGTIEERSQFGETFLYHLLKGYYEEFDLGEEWIERIPLFLELRDITLYSVLYKKLDDEKLKKQEALLTSIKDRIKNGQVILNIDYKALINRLNK